MINYTTPSQIRLLSPAERVNLPSEGRSETNAINKKDRLPEAIQPWVRAIDIQFTRSQPRRYGFNPFSLI